MVAAPKAAKTVTATIGSLVRLSLLLHSTELRYYKDRQEKDKRMLYALGKQLDTKITAWFTAPVASMQQLNTMMVALRQWRDKQRVHVSLKTEESFHNWQNAVAALWPCLTGFLDAHPEEMPIDMQRNLHAENKRCYQAAQHYLKVNNLPVVKAVIKDHTLREYRCLDVNMNIIPVPQHFAQHLYQC